MVALDSWLAGVVESVMYRSKIFLKFGMYVSEMVAGSSVTP